MAKRAPHVLLLGFQFPPARGSGVYRIRAWANHLARRGMDVTVVTVEPNYWKTMAGDLDEGLAATVDPRVRIAPFSFPHEYLIGDVRKMSWAHANLPTLYIKGWKKIPQAFFPEVYGHAYPLMVARGLKVAAQRPVDMVLATGNPYAQYGSAWALGKLLRVPYIVDYHDPWTMDLWKEADAFPPDHPAWAWERRIVEGAWRTVTVNAPLVEWYKQRYPKIADRVRLVENGFADDVVGVPHFQPKAPGSPISVGFLGTIRGDLPLEEYLDGWRLARQDPSMADAQMTFHGYLGFFTGNQEAVRRRITGLEGDGVHYAGPVSQTRIHEVLQRHDVMAMLLTSSRYVTAGKGYDYMASGRPVAGIHDPRNDTTTAFARYPLFFGVEKLNDDGVRDALLAAADAARNETVEQFDRARAEAMRHTWDEQLRPLADEMEKELS